MAVTSMLCQCNRSRKNAEPALLQMIDFKKTITAVVTAEYSKTILTPDKIAELKNIMPTAAYFTTINEACAIGEEASDDTASADENENIFPETLTSLFDYTAINLDDKILEKLCTQKYETSKSLYTEQSYIDLAEVTKTQIHGNYIELAE